MTLTDMRRGRKLNFFLTLCVGFYVGTARAEDTVDQALRSLRSELASVRLEEPDLRMGAGWDLPLTIPSVERFFAKPLTMTATTSAWLDQLEGVDTLAGAGELAREILAKKSNPHPGPLPQGERELQYLRARAPFATLPPPLQDALPPLIHALESAQPLLNKAVDSIPATARQDFLEMSDWPNAKTGAVKEDISARRTLHRYAALKKFNDLALLDAADLIFRAVDDALPLLSSPWDGPSRMRFSTRIGTVLVSGSADDTYTDDDLKDIVLLIDAGGHNTYAGRPALAREKEIRVVIDLGADLTVTAPAHTMGGAGTGAFGIGIFVAPAPRGTKNISTGSFSQGAGLGGVGALWLGGQTHLSAERFAQGAATLGLGVLRADSAAQSSYVATRSAQGFALTRGVGLFLHRGDHADIKGGLVEPDPREPNGSVSLCQGVGFGPRAYAGGGVGLAMVAGSHITVLGSYFSQGAGYWHGLGGFRLRGSDATLQARRYDMGSGVHSAFGHFEVIGDRNRILNWGVGPSYGWDHSVGSSMIVGDGNEVQVDWGSGTGSIGSLSFSFFKLTNSKLKLCNFGGSAFFRDEPAYSVQWLEGSGNELQCQGEAQTGAASLRRFQSPWGLFRMSGTRLNEKLTLAPPQWPALAQEQTIQRESVNLQQSIREAQTKTPIEHVADLVDVAAAFSLDKKSPRDAFAQLLRLPPEQARLLVDVLEPAAIDQLIQLSILIPAQGDVVTRDIVHRLDRFPLQKKTVLVNFLRMGRPSSVMDEALRRLNKRREEMMKPALVRTMATLLNNNPGDDPGTRALLTALEKTLSSPDDAIQKKAASDLLARLPFASAFGLLATVLDLSAAERDRFFDAAPEDLTNTLQPKGAEAFLQLITARQRAALDRVRFELATLNSHETAVRVATAALLTSTRTAIQAGALVALGQIANEADIAMVTPFLTHQTAAVREAAAVALARMGDAALETLTHSLSTETPRTRALIMAGLSQTSSAALINLLEQGWRDPDPQVELTAIATLGQLSPVLAPQRPELIAQAKKILASNTNAEVALALVLLK